MLTIKILLGSSDPRSIAEMIFNAIGRPIDNPETLQVKLEISEGGNVPATINISMFPENPHPIYDEDENYTLLATYTNYTKETSIKKMIDRGEAETVVVDFSTTTNDGNVDRR